MFGKKKIELIDDHFDDEDIDESPKLNNTSSKFPPTKTSTQPTVNKTTQNIIDTQNKLMEKQVDILFITIHICRNKKV
jgi:hypothetical protein